MDTYVAVLFVVVAMWTITRQIGVGRDNGGVGGSPCAQFMDLRSVGFLCYIFKQNKFRAKSGIYQRLLLCKCNTQNMCDTKAKDRIGNWQENSHVVSLLSGHPQPHQRDRRGANDVEGSPKRRMSNRSPLHSPTPKHNSRGWVFKQHAQSAMFYALCSQFWLQFKIGNPKNVEKGACSLGQWATTKRSRDKEFFIFTNFWCYALSSAHCIHRILLQRVLNLR